MIEGVAVPVPAVVLGVLVGLTYGALAVGLILIYRANRIINFAQGQLGVLAAACLAVAVNDWHLPYYLALAGALAIGAGSGCVAEYAVVRRLRAAPSLMTIVATLGLGEFLLYLADAIDQQTGTSVNYPSPPGMPAFAVGALQVTPANTAMLVFVPAAVLAAGAFLRLSATGRAMRGACDDRDLARTCGVSADHMSSGAWAIAGALAALSSVLIAPTTLGGSGTSLGPDLLLRALVPFAIAGMTSIPVALLAGIAVGIVEQVILWNWPGGGGVEFALFAAVLVVTVLRRGPRDRSAARTDWTAVRAWARLNAAQRANPMLRLAARGGALLSLAAALLITSLVSNGSAVSITMIATLAIVGLSIGVLTGLAGQLTLGQYAVAGVGGAIAVQVSLRTGNLWLALAAGAAAGAVTCTVIGLPALRHRGFLPTVTTLAFALMAPLWLLPQKWLIGNQITPPTPVIAGIPLSSGRSYAYFAVLTLAACALVAWNVRRGGLGRLMTAVRDNANAAQALGVSPAAVRLRALAIAGALAGIGGAVVAHSVTVLLPADFSPQTSIDVVALTVLGGISVLAGPIIGALYVVGIPRFLPLSSAALAASSLGWLVLILYFPGGLAQLIAPVRQAVLAFVERRFPAPEPSRRDEASSGATAIKAGLGAAKPRPGAATSGDAPPLSLDHVTLRYGGLTAVDDVSLTVRAGETLGLIGPNGAGKTTLFEIASGFARPDAGVVRLHGQDITRMRPEARCRHGLVRSFQDAALFPTLTTLECVMLALEGQHPTRIGSGLAGARRAESRKERQGLEFLARTGLAAYAHREIRELSTGMRRLTELACVTALRPTVLLLDEPAAGIAQREVEALAETLRAVRTELGCTLIVIEHDIPFVTLLADRVVAMDAGKIIADGSPDQVRKSPSVAGAYLGTDLHAIGRSGAAPDTIR